MSKTIYTESNEKIEQVSRLLYFIAMKFTFPGVMLPDLIVTFYNYFVHDLGDQSYYLACPAMYVQNVTKFKLAKQ